jgi:ketosteroid isomerase-like protein
MSIDIVASRISIPWSLNDDASRERTDHNDDMTDEAGRNIATVHKYLAALQRGEAGEKLREFFTEDVRQVEMPNQLNSRGQESDLEHILQRSLQGLRILQHQEYEIVSAVAQEDRVAVEARWTGTLAVPLGKMEPGAQMGASFAIFFLFREGKIAIQRNYDCFDPL